MNKVIKYVSTFLLISVVLFYTSVVAFASNYVGMNDTVYKMADYFGFEELPYGADTGVVQIQFDTDKYLTMFFDKLSIYDKDEVHNTVDSSNLNDYYWDIKLSGSSGNWDYLFSCDSDNPIYYKWSYAANSIFNSTVGGRTAVNVMTSDQVFDGTTYPTTTTYVIYRVSNLSLKSLIGWDVVEKNSFRIYSNCYMSQLSNVTDNFGDTSLLYNPVVPAGWKAFVNGAYAGYNVKYYPSVEYLQNISIRQTLLEQWNLLNSIDITSGTILDELYTANIYLKDLRTYLYQANAKLLNIYNLESVQLPLVNENLSQIIELLEGPEYDSSTGIGSNTEFGDSVGGMLDDTKVPSIGIDSVTSNLGNSFLFIRNMFDWVTVEFNLVFIISFLLALSFIAYVLGRVIKNKMNT